MTRNNPIFIRLLVLIVLLFIGLALVSCRTAQVLPAEIPAEKYLTNDTRHDSIYIHDSIMVRVVTGTKDTVFTDRWHTRIKEVVQVRTDSVEKPYPVYITKEVKKVPPWAWYALAFSILVILITLALLGIKIYRRFRL